MQLAEELAEALSPKLPAVHATQLDVPVLKALYEPTTHAVHDVEVLAAATLPKRPAEHAVHTEVPVANAL